MFDRVLNVKYIADKHCFLHLPSSIKLSASDNCVKLTHNDHQNICFSVYTPSVIVDEQYVGLNSLYAKALGIQENDTVTVKEIDRLPTVKKISIIALNNEDYEVLELLSENIQGTLLDQIRVVNAGHNIVIWVGNINVVVFVEEVSPISPGILDFLSEVVIKPPAVVNSKSVCPSIDSCSKNGQKANKFLNFFEEPHITDQDDDKLSVYKSYRSDTILRIVPIDNFPHIKDVSKKIYPFSVFSSKRNFTDTWHDHSSERAIFCSLTLLNSAVSSSTVFVRLCFLEDYEVSCCGEQSNNIYVDDCIINLFKCDLGERVILKHITKYTCVNEIEIHGKKSNTNLVEKVKQFLADNNEQPMILNSDIVLDIGNSTYVSFEFLPDKCKYCVIEGNFLREVKYSTVEVGLTKSESSQVLPKTKCVLEISNFQKIYEAIMTNYTTDKKYFDFQNVLIIGKPGTGKSTLLGIICDKLREFPHFVRTETLQCKMLKGKTVDSLHKTFTELFNKLLHGQPSVLLLDDLHILCEHVNVGEETPNSVYFNRVSEMIRCFINKFSKYREIGVIATCESISKLNGNIYKSRGSYIFKNVHNISNLNKKDRELLLNFLFEDTCKSYVSFDELATRTEGFVAQDLVDFYNKALFESYKDESADGVDGTPIITFDHCEKALKNTTALSLLNVKFNESCTKDFSDIGGLHDIKKVLVESLLWPTQYPTIFDDAPLRLQSGLLLYGPPGSGKTLLAGAAARHCRLRLIAVKGPELLSKYIGASEQAVRDIFERAQSARPCILFFDEFDSLAPRRGHDNTGVTDRVVNQLLTQLDGIESLSGVCVLAATSRPDLLDPALLRPGRLDRQLLCPMPDKEARSKILKVLSKNMNLKADVDLVKIALKTQGYSGADLQAILYTAQLSSVENIWRDDFKEFSEKGNVITTQITQQHLEDALQNTKPSLNDTERKKYERIYAKFQRKSVEDFKPGTRATLA